MTAPSSWLDRRTSSLLVLVLIVIAALVVDIDAAMTWREDARSVANLEARTELLEARAATAASAQPDGSAALVDARLLIGGETSGLVSAELQRIISDLAQGAGAAVRSLEVSESEPVADTADTLGNGLVRVRLNADIEVMEPALPDLLYAIETHMPMLVVDALTLRTNRRIDTASTEGAAPETDRPLALRLTVSAFHVKEPG